MPESCRTFVDGVLVGILLATLLYTVVGIWLPDIWLPDEGKMCAERLEKIEFLIFDALKGEG